MHKILVIRLYFLLDALHVSDYISPSTGATFISCTSHLVYVGVCQTPNMGWPLFCGTKGLSHFKQDNKLGSPTTGSLNY